MALTIYYPSQQFKRYIQYLLALRQTFDPLVLLVGAEGVGKSTLIKEFFNQCPDKENLLVFEDAENLTAEILQTDLAKQAGSRDKSISNTVANLNQQQRKLIYLIDNAEKLPLATMSFMMQCLQEQKATHYHLYFVLVGLPALKARINNLLGIWADRVQVPCFNIDTLTQHETELFYQFMREQAVQFIEPFEILYEKTSGNLAKMQNYILKRPRIKMEKTPETENEQVSEENVKRNPHVRWISLTLLVILFALIWYWQHHKDLTKPNAALHAASTAPLAQEQNSDNGGQANVSASDKVNEINPSAQTSAQASTPANQTLNNSGNTDLNSTNAAETLTHSMPENSATTTTNHINEPTTASQINAPAETTTSTNTTPIVAAPAATTANPQKIVVKELPIKRPERNPPRATAAPRAAPAKAEKKSSSMQRIDSIDSGFVLQLAASNNLNAIRTSLKSSGLKNSRIYRMSRDGQTWYILVTGNYTTAAAAKAAKNQLPANLREKNPWVRSQKTLQGMQPVK